MIQSYVTPNRQNCKNVTLYHLYFNHSSIHILQMNGPETSSGCKQLLRTLLPHNSSAQECDETMLNQGTKAGIKIKLLLIYNWYYPTGKKWGTILSVGFISTFLM
jgi:hypothetical protein